MTDSNSENGSRFTNLAGKQIPKESQYPSIPLEPGERILSKEEETQFWSSRQEIAKRVTKDVGEWYADHFGCPAPQEFDPTFYELVEDTNGDNGQRLSFAGRCDALTGRIRMEIGSVKSDKNLAAVMAHELGHVGANRLTREDQQESGIKAIGLRQWWGEKGMVLGIIDEAIIETTSAIALHDVAPDLKPNPHPEAYLMYVRMLNLMCDNMAPVLGRQSSEVYAMFQQATFSDGRTNLFRSLAKVYGKQYLLQIAELSALLEDADEQDLIGPKYSQIYDNIIELVSKPNREKSLESATSEDNRVTKEYEVAGKKFVIDYANLHEEAIIGKWKNGNTNEPGIEYMVGSVFWALNLQLNTDDYGQIIASDSLPPGERVTAIVPVMAINPNIAENLSPVSLSRRVSQDSYTLLSETLDEEIEPSFESRGQMRVTYHELQKIAPNKEGKKAYLVHVWHRTFQQKVYPMVLSDEDMEDLGATKVETY